MNSEVEFAFRSNLAVNRALLKHLTPEMLLAVTPGGGYTIAQHLAHMTWCIKYWLHYFDPSSASSLANLYDPNTENFAETDLGRIAEVMQQTHEAALWAAWHTTDMKKSPHSSPAQFLMHMAMHDAHHRGQILLALKVSGFALPDEDAMWQPLRS